MLSRLLLSAVGDGEGGVVERVGALRVAVGPAHPAFDGLTLITRPTDLAFEQTVAY